MLRACWRISTALLMVAVPTHNQVSPIRELRNCRAVCSFDRIWVAARQEAVPSTMVCQSGFERQGEVHTHTNKQMV